MTKKEYELIAGAIYEKLHENKSVILSAEGKYYRAQGMKLVVEALAEKLSNENTKFDREKFLWSCGV